MHVYPITERQLEYDQIDRMPLPYVVESLRQHGVDNEIVHKIGDNAALLKALCHAVDAPACSFAVLRWWDRLLKITPNIDLTSSPSWPIIAETLRHGIPQSTHMLCNRNKTVVSVLDLDLPAHLLHAFKNEVCSHWGFSDWCGVFEWVMSSDGCFISIVNNLFEMGAPIGFVCNALVYKLGVSAHEYEADINTDNRILTVGNGEAIKHVRANPVEVLQPFLRDDHRIFFKFAAAVSQFACITDPYLNTMAANTFLKFMVDECAHVSDALRAAVEKNNLVAVQCFRNIWNGFSLEQKILSLEYALEERLGKRDDWFEQGYYMHVLDTLLYFQANIEGLLPHSVHVSEKFPLLASYCQSQRLNQALESDAGHDVPPSTRKKI